MYLRVCLCVQGQIRAVFYVFQCLHTHISECLSESILACVFAHLLVCMWVSVCAGVCVCDVQEMGAGISQVSQCTLEQGKEIRRNSFPSTVIYQALTMC